jgi:hypothetical protein
MEVVEQNKERHKFLDLLGGAQSRALVFPNNFKELPPFLERIRTTIISSIKDGVYIDKDTLHMSMAPTLEARSYRTMYAFGNCIHVSSAEKHLTTCDNGVATTFDQICILRQNDTRFIITNLEYVGWVEGILELNYRVLKIVVLLCNWVKPNYDGNSATIKCDEYGFTLMNFSFLIPILDASFAFPLHI